MMKYKKLLSKGIMLLILCVFSFTTLAQNNVSKSKDFHIVKQFVPPILEIENLSFEDADGNNFIDGQENCKLRFQVSNRGNGDGYGCKAIVAATGTTVGLSFTNKSLPIIKSGEKIWVEIPISADMNTEMGTVTFSIKIDEPKGFDSDSKKIQIGTRQFESPFVEVVSHKVTVDNGGLLTKRMQFILQVMVQNIGRGVAEDIKVEVSFPEKNSTVFCNSGNEISSFDKLASGSIKTIEYQFFINSNYNSTDLPLIVTLTEKYKKYAKSDTITLKVEQTIANNSTIVVTGKEEERQAITRGSFYSDVDVNIPQIQTETENENTFAVIIGNENYKKVSKVPYALNDSKIFREYCEKTLGIPADHIKYSADATLNDVRANINWLKDITDVFSDAKVIFYYAGHGIPDDASKSAYLLPVDGYGTDVTTGYQVDELYSELGSLSTKSVTIFLDACFSGAKREGDMLMAARGVAIKTKSGQPVGNMVVFSASTGDETAAGFDKEHHGLFTYFLLKKLQETQGNVTYEDLANYIKENVGKQSVLNGKRQTPTVIPSAEIQNNWRILNLR